MRKFAALFVLAIAIAIPAASMADPLPDEGTPIGTIHAHQIGNGGEIYADGAASNPDPLDGYAGVEGNVDDQSIEVHCSDEGSWDDQDGDGVPDSEEEEPQGREGCNPAP